ncbi:MAG: hypothetical protein L0Z53_22325 [Acidobacteriales bacterium]|nr:hypothetical protein [Terriglobales bacterium]
MRRRVDDVIDRFLDGQLPFEPAISELTPLFRSWFEHQNAEEERRVDYEIAGSDRPTFIARDDFPIARGRSEEERKRAMELVKTIVIRGLANGAA